MVRVIRRTGLRDDVALHGAHRKHVGPVKPLLNRGQIAPVGVNLQLALALEYLVAGHGIPNHLDRSSGSLRKWAAVALIGAEAPSDNGSVGHSISDEPTIGAMLKFGVLNLHEVDSPFRQHLPPSLVIEAPLFSAMNSADGHSVRLVEMRNRLGVLALPVLDHKFQVLVVGINREEMTCVAA
jgi:hypothetical protein